MPRRLSSRSILAPASRRLVSGLLIAAGILLVIGELLGLYVLLAAWRHLGVLGAGPLARVLLGLVSGALTSYLGWRVGLAQQDDLNK